MDKINITQSGNGYLLRISMSERCNYDCSFCHPPKEDVDGVLTCEELHRIINAINSIYKLKAIHFTGGEPLMRKELVSVVRFCRSIVEKDVDIAMTTNGSLLGDRLLDLARSGLTRANVSIHTFRQDRYEMLTKTKYKINVIKDVLKEAKSIGINIKLNSVVIRDFNDDEMYDIADYCFDNDILLRFLELYLSGPVKEWFSYSNCVFHDEILERMRMNYGFFDRDFAHYGNGAAKYYRNSSGKVFGIINNESEKKCVGCDRIRLSVNGMIKFCTFQPVDLKPYLQNDDLLKEKLIEMAYLFSLRGKDYVGKRRHEIDYYFRWNQFDQNSKNMKGWENR